MTVILFILLNGMLFFSSYLLANRYFQNSNLSEQLVGTFILFMSQVSISILFLGVVIRDLGIIPVVLLNTAISGSIIFILRARIAEAFTRTGSQLKEFAGSITREKDYILYGLTGLFLLQVIILAFKIYYLPAQVWDVFTYHLHPVVEWLQQNRIPAHIETPVLRVNVNPLGAKLVHFWIVRFFNDLTGVEIPQFLAGIFLFLSSYSIIRKLKIPPHHALRWAILIYFIPNVLIQSRTCQDHLWMNTLLVITTLYVINVFYEKKSHHLLFLFLSLGLLLGSKQNAITAVLVLFPTLLVCNGFDAASIRGFFKDNRFRIWTGILALLALCGYWLGRNDGTVSEYLSYLPGTWGLKILPPVLIGVPLLYILYMIIKTRRFTRIPSILRGWSNKKRAWLASVFVLGGVGIVMALKFHAALTFLSRFKTATFSFSPLYWDDPDKMSHIVSNILSFPIRVKDTASMYTPDLSDISGFGIQFFAFGLVSYLIAGFLFLTRRMRRVPPEIPGARIESFLFLYPVLLLSCYFLYYYESVSYRLFIFFPVFGIILWASILSKLNVRKWIMLYLDILVIIMIVFCMATCFFEGNTNPSKWKSLVTMDNPVNRTSIAFSPQLTGEDWTFIDNYIPPDKPVGYTGGINSWVFPYFDNRMKRRIYYIESLEGFKAEPDKKHVRVLVFTAPFIETLKKRGIRFLHINPKGVRPEERIYIRADEPCVRKICENLYYII